MYIIRRLPFFFFSFLKTKDDLHLNELERVRLIAAFEQALNIRVSESIVWHRSTTLESLYIDVEKQLAVNIYR